MTAYKRCQQRLLFPPIFCNFLVHTQRKIQSELLRMSDLSLTRLRPALPCKAHRNPMRVRQVVTSPFEAFSACKVILVFFICISLSLAVTILSVWDRPRSHCSFALLAKRGDLTAVSLCRLQQWFRRLQMALLHTWPNLSYRGHQCVVYGVITIASMLSSSPCVLLLISSGDTAVTK